MGVKEEGGSCWSKRISAMDELPSRWDLPLVLGAKEESGWNMPPGKGRFGQVLLGGASEAAAMYYSRFVR